VRPVAVSPEELAGATLGRFQFLSAAQLTAAGPGAAGFGGLSAIARDGSRWLAVSDQGAVVRFPLKIDGQGRIAPFALGDEAAVEIIPLRGPDGAVLEGAANVDAEGLAPAPDGGWFVSLERNHRLLRYARGGLGAAAVAGPPQIGFEGLEPNGGMEALARLPDGRLLAAAEYGPQTGRAAPPYWLIAPFQREPAAPAGAFTIEGAFGITEAQVEGDRVWLLKRAFTAATGRLEMTLERCSLVTVLAGAPRCAVALALAPPFPMDNYEGLALLPDPAGRGTLFLILSDDNFSATQRTLALTFLLPEN
jgi:hypothetical protein